MASDEKWLFLYWNCPCSTWLVIPGLADSPMVYTQLRIPLQSTFSDVALNLDALLASKVHGLFKPSISRSTPTMEARRFQRGAKDNPCFNLMHQINNMGSSSPTPPRTTVDRLGMPESRLVVTMRPTISDPFLALSFLSIPSNEDSCS